MTYPTDAINAVKKAILALDSDVVTFCSGTPTAAKLATLLVDLKQIADDLDIISDQVSTFVDEAMNDFYELVLEDGTKVEKRLGVNRKTWQHIDLATEVARRLQDLSIDLDTGERLLTTEEMILKLLDYVQPSYWRVKTLAQIGINADNFCEVSDGKTSIIIRKAK